MLNCCCMTTELIDFSDHLINILNILDISQVDLAKKARLDKSIISRLINRERKPTPETLISIAKAINYPPEEVFRWAGLLPPETEKDNLTEEAEFLLSQLTEPQRKQAVKFIRFLAEEKGEYNASDSMAEDG